MLARLRTERSPVKCLMTASAMNIVEFWRIGSFRNSISATTREQPTPLYATCAAQQVTSESTLKRHCVSIYNERATCEMAIEPVWADWTSGGNARTTTPRDAMILHGVSAGILTIMLSRTGTSTVGTCHEAGQVWVCTGRSSDKPKKFAPAAEHRTRFHTTPMTPNSNDTHQRRRFASKSCVTRCNTTTTALVLMRAKSSDRLK